MYNTYRMQMWFCVLWATCVFLKTLYYLEFSCMLFSYGLKTFSMFSGAGLNGLYPASLSLDTPSFITGLQLHHLKWCSTLAGSTWFLVFLMTSPSTPAWRLVFSMHLQLDTQFVVVVSDIVWSYTLCYSLHRSTKETRGKYIQSLNILFH